MTNQQKDTFNQILRDRTFDMAVQVHELLQFKKVRTLDRPIVNQLIRSSSSVAANIRAAARARSDAEFFSKICIVTEECDETQFWIDYCVRVNLLTIEECVVIKSEVDEEVRIFSSIKKKMKDKLQDKSKI